ncbi:hypothetical protein BU17DRAFT_44591 [Hysterangium stoloniferum]|nr:hypothetical protein BU17DRAFT_44591 [Hysterangium stoloniferum]
MRREWEEAHAVTEETVAGPPSRRANATLTACPSGNHLWCIGGEFFSEDGKAHFYNDVYRYSPEKDEWRRFTSPTCPGPRSAHAVAAIPASGGKLFLFGGEFSSLHQTTFHHYRDFWSFDISSHTWERIDTKVKPSARSGCRMAVWKHFIVLFGGFYDPGIRTNYLNDLWLFDTQEYTWQQVELRDTDRKPSQVPRSGFSFLPTADGIVLHVGGYCKEYIKGKRAVGIALQDTWFLKYVHFHSAQLLPHIRALTLLFPCRMTTDLKLIKWERRKKSGYAPSLRSGCTMALWQTRSVGVLFGGVFDEDKGEEGLESTFYNDLYAYQMSGNGRWSSLTLRKPKKTKQVPPQKKKQYALPHPVASPARHYTSMDEDGEQEGYEDDEHLHSAHDSHPPPASTRVVPVEGTSTIDVEDQIDPNDPSLTVPLVRYNAMLSVLRNTLYIYGGIFESHSREYTLDDFHALNLDKMDRYVCLKQSEVVIGADDESSDDEDDDDDDGDDDGEGDSEEDNEGDGEKIVNRHVADSDEEDDGAKTNESDDNQVPIVQTPEEIQRDKDELRKLATSFMGVSKDNGTRSEEDAISTPLPGETLALFYARSREYWAQKALEKSDNRGKMLRRDGFSLAEERYASYKPILEEVQKILAEAGLDEDEMKRAGAAGSGKGGDVGNRNRR